MTSWEKSLHVLASAAAKATAQKMTRARAAPAAVPPWAASSSFGATNEAERRKFTLFSFDSNARSRAGYQRGDSQGTAGDFLFLSLTH